MRRFSWLVLGLLATGCAEIPEAEDLPTADDSRSLSLAYEAIPDREDSKASAPAPTTELEPELKPKPSPGRPRIIVSDYDEDATDEYGEADGTAGHGSRRDAQ